MSSRPSEPWAETVARRRAVLDRLRAVMIESLRLELAPDQIDPDASLFGGGLGLDSIDALELVVAVEDAFGVVASDRDAPALSLRTANLLVDRILAEGGG